MKNTLYQAIFVQRETGTVTHGPWDRTKPESANGGAEIVGFGVWEYTSKEGKMTQCKMTFENIQGERIDLPYF